MQQDTVVCLDRIYENVGQQRFPEIEYTSSAACFEYNLALKSIRVN